MVQNNPEVFVEAGVIIFYIRKIQKPAIKRVHLNMADSEGFEPPVGLTLRLISSQVH